MNVPRALLLLLTACLTLWQWDSLGQERGPITISLLAVNGNTGKPLAHVRFLVFGGLSEQGVRRHDEVTEFSTNGDGRAVLVIDETKIKWIGVVPDFYAVCVPSSHTGIFDVEMIRERGVAMPNACNKRVNQEPVRGEFVIYARPETFLERLRR